MSFHRASVYVPANATMSHPLISTYSDHDMHNAVRTTTLSSHLYVVCSATRWLLRHSWHDRSSPQARPVGSFRVLDRARSSDQFSSNQQSPPPRRSGKSVITIIVIIKTIIKRAHTVTVQHKLKCTSDQRTNNAVKTTTKSITKCTHTVFCYHNMWPRRHATGSRYAAFFSLKWNTTHVSYVTVTAILHWMLSFCKLPCSSTFYTPNQISGDTSGWNATGMAFVFSLTATKFEISVLILQHTLF